MKYEITGGSLPVLICNLNPDESLISESGSMSWMSPNMKMETTSNGGIGKALGRMFAGESLFQNRYTAVGSAGQIAFASSFPGSIKAFEITPENPIVVQKRGMLAAEEGVELSVFFQKRIAAGIFGGEGFVMQKFSGNGTAFVEIDGHAVEYNLAAGESIVVDTGYLAAMSASCSIDIVSVKGAKNIFLGGEGVFNTVIHGPGKVILQSMPISAVANRMRVHLNINSSTSK